MRQTEDPQELHVLPGLAVLDHHPLLRALHPPWWRVRHGLVQEPALAVPHGPGPAHVLLPSPHLLDVHRGHLPPLQGLYQRVQLICPFLPLLPYRVG